MLAETALRLLFTALGNVNKECTERVRLHLRRNEWFMPHEEVALPVAAECLGAVTTIAGCIHRLHLDTRRLPLGDDATALVAATVLERAAHRLWTNLTLDGGHVGVHSFGLLSRIAITPRCRLHVLPYSGTGPVVYNMNEW